jgi:antitoxin component of MazEF toxin-antitoxin module
MTSLVRFRRRIRQSGGSLGVTIPDELLKAAELVKGDMVQVYVNDKRQIIVEKAP